MKLRKPCEEHGRYDAHGRHDRDTFCPGGVFLPDDTLDAAFNAAEQAYFKATGRVAIGAIRVACQAFLDALFVREAE